MFWKERHTSAGGGLLAGEPADGAFFGVLLGCYLLDVSYPVLSDWLDGRWRLAPRRGGERRPARFERSPSCPGDAGSRRRRSGESHRRARARHLDQPGDDAVDSGRDRRAEQFGAVWSARRVGIARPVYGPLASYWVGIHPLGVLAWGVLRCCHCLADCDDWSFRVIHRQKLDPRTVATFIAILVFSAVTQWPATVWLLLFSYQNFALFVGQSPQAVNGPEEVLSLALRLSQFLALYALIGAWLTLGSTRRLRRRGEDDDRFRHSTSSKHVER